MTTSDGDPMNPCEGGTKGGVVAQIEGVFEDQHLLKQRKF